MVTPASLLRVWNCSSTLHKLGNEPKSEDQLLLNPCNFYFVLMVVLKFNVRFVLFEVKNVAHDLFDKFFWLNYIPFYIFAYLTRVVCSLYPFQRFSVLVPDQNWENRSLTKIVPCCIEKNFLMFFIDYNTILINNGVFFNGSNVWKFELTFLGTRWSCWSWWRRWARSWRTPAKVKL